MSRKINIQYTGIFLAGDENRIRLYFPWFIKE